MFPLQQVAAQTVAAVERARSLFGSAESANATAGRLDTAAHAAAGATQPMSMMSGQLTDRHQSVVTAQTQRLSTAGRTDTTLESLLTNAAAVTQHGSRQLDGIVARTKMIQQLAASARTPADQLLVLKALREQVAASQSVVNTTQQHATEVAGQVQKLSYGPGGSDAAPTDRPKTPPHGKDPRYWIDVGKIIHVPDGELAPPNTVQVGPNLYHPAPDRPGFATPPPPPAKYPLDGADIRVVEPGQLFPPGYKEVAPNIGVPDPGGFNAPQTPPAPPQRPIDIRDIIEVPPGQLAPSGYIEYFPGWFAPGPSPSYPDPQPR